MTEVADSKMLSTGIDLDIHSTLPRTPWSYESSERKKKGQYDCCRTLALTVL